MFRLFGQEPGSIVPSPEYVMEQVHPEDAARVQEVVDAHGGRQRRDDLDYRILLPDGKVRHLQARVAALEESDGERISSDPSRT